MKNKYPNFLVSIYTTERKPFTELYFYKRIQEDTYRRITSINSAERWPNNKVFTHNGITDTYHNKKVEEYDTIEDLTEKYFDILL
jgi:hypothetical protein